MDEVPEGKAKVVPFGNDNGECAIMYVHHNGERRLAACGGVCPHQNASLDGAVVMGSEIVCARHGFRFDAISGDCCTLGGYGVPIFAVHVDGDMVYVSYIEFGE